MEDLFCPWLDPRPIPLYVYKCLYVYMFCFDSSSTLKQEDQKAFRQAYQLKHCYGWFDWYSVYEGTKYIYTFLYLRMTVLSISSK